MKQKMTVDGRKDRRQGIKKVEREEKRNGKRRLGVREVKERKRNWEFEKKKLQERKKEV